MMPYDQQQAVLSSIRGPPMRPPLPWIPITVGLVGLIALAVGIYFMVDPPVSNVDPDRREQAKKDYLYGGLGLVLFAIAIWLGLAWNMWKNSIPDNTDNSDKTPDLEGSEFESIRQRY